MKVTKAAHVKWECKWRGSQSRDCHNRRASRCSCSFELNAPVQQQSSILPTLTSRAS